MTELTNLNRPLVSGGRILTGLAARKAKVAALAPVGAVNRSPSEAEHRIGIIFDDSGSMRTAQIADAHAGCEDFLRSCEKDKTSVAIYPLNATKMMLCSNLPALAILVKEVRATGGTPLVQKLNEMLRENNLTRAIVFSDGSPQSYSPDEYTRVLSMHIPVDTVYISDMYSDSTAERFMLKLAADTDGIYLHFERGKSNFRDCFKYLSPGLRYMLADKSFADKIQGK